MFKLNMACIVLFYMGYRLMCIFKTKYAFTNKRVLFQTCVWGREKVNSIEFNHISRISKERYPNNSGVVHFFSNNKLIQKEERFKTQELFWGYQRHYPAFEKIRNFDEVYDKLNFFYKKR